ncbi:MAG: hypothetical protein MJ246_08400 [Clostridia bacterium]|nr:hypothetical protein [Clostridia bacterium]
MIEFEEALYAQANSDKLDKEASERFEELNKKEENISQSRYFEDVKIVEEKKEEIVEPEPSIAQDEEIQLDNDELNKNLE